MSRSYPCHEELVRCRSGWRNLCSVLSDKLLEPSFRTGRTFDRQATLSAVLIEAESRIASEAVVGVPVVLALFGMVNDLASEHVDAQKLDIKKSSYIITFMPDYYPEALKYFREINKSRAN